MWLCTSNVVFKDERITGYYRRPALVFCGTSFRIHFVCHVQWLRSHLMRVMVRHVSVRLLQYSFTLVYCQTSPVKEAQTHARKECDFSDLFTHSVIFKHMEDVVDEHQPSSRLHPVCG